MRSDLKIVVIGGAGRIGLPLAILLAKNYDVSIYDIDQDKIKLLKENIAIYPEPNLEKELSQVNIKYPSNLDLKSYNVIIIAIGTEVDSEGNPKNEVLNWVHNYFDDLHKDQLIIVRSTVAPWIMESIYQKLQSKEIFLSCCPERTAEGKAFEEIRSFPQIVSGFEEEAIEITKEIFLTITKKIVVMSPEEACIAKLMCNSLRYCNFAFSNMFYKYCLERKLNFAKIRENIMVDYPRAKYLASSGFVGGYCLEKDTSMLVNDGNFDLLEVALKINKGFPRFIVEYLEQRYNLRKMEVGILGLSFKPDFRGYRNSKSIELVGLLGPKVKSLVVYDPLISMGTLEEVLKTGLIIVTMPNKEWDQIIKERRDIPQKVQILNLWK